MTHTYSKLLFHLIWSTKNREPSITDDIQTRLYGYIRKIVEDKKQFLVIINGMPDHVHLLVRLSPSITLSDIIKSMKTSSTKWVHAEFPKKRTFAWQEGFSAYTVGYSTEKKVIQYIESQAEHHKKFTFEEEYLNLLKMQKILFDERFMLG